jgi:Domain of unknown function (DUF4202)
MKKNTLMGSLQNRKMKNFEQAKQDIANIIANSKTEEDPTHSINAWSWLLKLYPNADEILQLAVLAHDIERGLPNRLTREQFSSYDEYKHAHASRGSKKAYEIALANGYLEDEATRLVHIIMNAEFESKEEDVQKVCDADSISFFDNNVDFYLNRSGEDKTKAKVNFMYSRAAREAKAEIDKILQSKPNI